MAESLMRFLMWLDWNLYANDHLLLIGIWSALLVGQLTGYKTTVAGAIRNILLLFVVWMLVVLCAYGTAVG